MVPPGESAFRFDAEESDALQEASNIAAAHVATALTKILEEDVSVHVSAPRVLDEKGLTREFGDALQGVIAVYIAVRGEDTRNMFLLVFPTERVLWFAHRFLRKQRLAARVPDEEDREAILEIGNILGCAYLNALATFLGITLTPSPPGLVEHTLDGVLDLPAVRVENRSRFAVVDATELVLGGRTSPGFLVFLPDARLQRRILARFGVRGSLRRNARRALRETG